MRFYFSYEPCKRHESRNGSVILLIVGILAVLLLAFGGFLRYSISRKFVTKKLNKVLLAREFSLSLASLACHQLKIEDLHNQNSKLCQELSTPLSSMKAQTSDKIAFSESLKETLNAIISANSELKNLSYSVGWAIQKEDFAPLLSAYPREKKGIIRIPITVSYALPGSKKSIIEEYLYTSDIVVAANLIPVLSKFTLLVQDARGGEKPSRFNLVKTDKSGNLSGSSYRPWVLNNGGKTGEEVPNRFNSFVESSRGLVYMGGGPLILANTRGWGSPGKYAEGFHLFKEGKGPGMYTVAWLGTTALINWEAGICDDKSDTDSQMWLDLVKDGFGDEAVVNSTFRLFGTDAQRSPTIVFGDVYTRTICCRIFKSSSKAYGILPFAKDNATFEKLKSGDDPKKDISFFISQVGNISLDYYNRKFASRVWEIPINRALGHILTNHRFPDPVTSGQINNSDPIADFISGKAIQQRKSHDIPEPFNKIFTDVSKLDSATSILQKISIPGNRTGYKLEINSGDTLIKALSRNGFLKNGKLDINGWLFVKSNQPISFNSSIELSSHGGIVLENGDIEIHKPITSAGDKFLLNLVTQNGNIRLSNQLSGASNISLTANGQVFIEGSFASTPPTIKGNVAMKQIAAGSLNTSIARGCNIDYCTQLSALPFQNNEKNSEKPLLMYSLAWEPKLVQ